MMMGLIGMVMTIWVMVNNIECYSKIDGKHPPIYIEQIEQGEAIEQGVVGVATILAVTCTTTTGIFMGDSPLKRYILGVGTLSTLGLGSWFAASFMKPNR